MLDEEAPDACAHAPGSRPIAITERVLEPAPDKQQSIVRGQTTAQ